MTTQIMIILFKSGVGSS